MRLELVAGNWKMNGGLAANARLLDRLASEWSDEDRRTLVVCVPSPYLWQTQAALTASAVRWGAQDVSEHDERGGTEQDAAKKMILPERDRAGDRGRGDDESREEPASQAIGGDRQRGVAHRELEPAEAEVIEDLARLDRNVVTST